MGGFRGVKNFLGEFKFKPSLRWIVYYESRQKSRSEAEIWTKDKVVPLKNGGVIGDVIICLFHLGTNMGKLGAAVQNNIVFS